MSGTQAIDKCDNGVGMLDFVFGDRDRKMTRAAGSTLRAWGVC